MARFLYFIVLFLHAAAAANAAELSGTLKSINDSGSISIGYRADAPPFSYEDENGNPTGYSIELCQRIASAIKNHLDLSDLKINYVPLDANERIDAVTSGKVDIECGNTTVTLGRRAEVDFTLMTFVTGGGFLSRRSNMIVTMDDLNGKKVGVIKDTTTADALNKHLNSNSIDAEVILVSDRIEGKQKLDAGEIHGLASDRAVLIGQVLDSEHIADYAISSDMFSYEPFAMTVRRDDPDFRLVADTALAKIFEGDQIVALWKKWFAKAGAEPSQLLLAMYRIQALPD